jgi:opacity protein-like surface antigen
MRSILLLLLTGISFTGYSQRISTYISGGLGISLEDNIAGYSQQNRSRYIGSAGVYYRLTDRFSTGAEAIASGRLDVFGKSQASITNPDNSIQLSPSNLKAGTILLVGKMVLFNYKEMEPYIGMGVGFNTFYYSEPVKGAGQLKKTSPVMSPEFGIRMYKFQFACKLIMGGKTPSYSGVDGNERKVTLQSTKPNQLYLTIGYQLFKF